MNVNNNNETIFSSTGELGSSIRPFERHYTNRGCTDLGSLRRDFNEGMARASEYPSLISRVVVRGLIGREARTAILDSDLRNNIEVLAPIGNARSLIYLGHNAVHRPGATSSIGLPQGMRAPLSLLPPIERIQSILDHGYTWSPDFSADDTTALYDLWGSTFGWEKNEVGNLRAKLKNERAQVPEDRTVWGSFVRYDGEIVGAAMAERLPGTMLVESTEWRLKANHQKRNNPNSHPNVMAAVLALINAQTLRDLGDPIIFAERNTRSGAGWAGRSAGLEMPPQEAGVEQILRQNVDVNDGIGIPGQYPDFAFLHLAPSTIQNFYQPEQTQAMIELARNGGDT